jgi:transcriptional regulator with XRE-family HTH domain
MGDYKNLIKQFREKKGMSQRQLAAAIGVSQQQIQRFEAGTPVKLDVALSLAQSLDVPVAKLFPGSGKAIHQIQIKGGPALEDSENEEQLLKVGIEIDPAVWSARVVVRGGDPKKPICYRINVHDKKRLEDGYLVAAPFGDDDADQSANKSTFFVFDAGDRRVAVNMDHVIFWQNCFDYGRVVEREGGERFTSRVNVYLAGAKEPMEFFNIESDPEENQSEDGLDEGPFRDLLCTLDMDPEKRTYIHFEDEDAEEAYFRVGDIAILEIAKDVTDIEELLDEDDSEPVKDTNPVVQ